MIQQAHKKILHARDEHQKHLAATEEIRGHLSAEGYDARLAEFQNTAAAKDVDRALESAPPRDGGEQWKDDPLNGIRWLLVADLVAVARRDQGAEQG